MNDSEKLDLYQRLGLDHAARELRRQTRQTPAEAEAEVTATFYERLGLYNAAAAVRAEAKQTPEEKELPHDDVNQG